MRSLLEILSRRPCQETPLEISCPEVWPRDLLQRSVPRELLYTVLVHRSCPETSYGDLVQRPGEESRGVPRRSFIDSLNRDLIFEIPYQDLLWKSPIGTLYR